MSHRFSNGITYVVGRLVWVAGILLVSGVLLPGVFTTGGATAQELLDWRQDIEHVRAKYKSVHVQPFHTASEEAMDALFDDLLDQLPNLNREEVLVRIAGLCAKIGDGHSAFWLYPREENHFTRLPVCFYVFEGDWRIIGSGHKHLDILGAQVLKINGIEIAEVFDRLKSVTPADNEMTFDSVCPRYASIPQVLKGLGVIQELEEVSFQVRKDERVFDTRIAAEDASKMPSLADLRFDLDSSMKFHSVVNGSDAPNWLKEKPSMWFRPDGKNYWFHHDSDLGVAYINITRFADMEDESFESFIKKVFAKIDDSNVTRLVLDIRLHAGGNNYYTKPLLLEILKRPNLNRRDRLFVIIGRRTFSAGMHLSTKLELYSNATFVGEPTGGSPNHYADNRGSRMPNSRLPVHFSTMYWQNSVPFPHETRTTQNPHLFTPLTFDAFKKKIDPAMEAIIEYQHQERIYDRLRRMSDNFSAESVVAMWSKFKSDPKNRFVVQAGFEEMLRFANEKSLEKEYRHAATIYQALYPAAISGGEEVSNVVGAYAGTGGERRISCEDGLLFYDNGNERTQLVPVASSKYHFLWRPGIVTEIVFTKENDRIIMEMIEQDGTITFRYPKIK